VVRDLYKFVEYFSLQKQKPTMPHLIEPINSPISPTKMVSSNNAPFIVSIEGNIGAGKSTMCSVISRIIETESGKIEIDGVETARVNLETLRSKITVIP